MADFKVKSLSNVMGAEITGLDLNNKLSNEDKQKLIKAITDHLVICIKNQNLSAKKLVEISKIFGTPKKYFVKDETIENIPEVIVVTNRTKDNKPAVYASHWHTDDSYRDKPATLTFIYPEILPENGGGTDFINCYSVYNDLPSKIKNKILTSRAIHKWQSSCLLYTSPSPRDR